MALLGQLFGCERIKMAGASADTSSDDFSVLMSLRCGLGQRIPAEDVLISLLGVTRVDGGPECVVAHCAGLPGAFPIAITELERFRERIAFAGDSGDEDESDPSLERAVAEAVLRSVTAGNCTGDVLKEVLFEARKHGVTLKGMTQLLTASVGAQSTKPAPSFNFPYYCAVSSNDASRSTPNPSEPLLPAEKRYFDLSDRLCGTFHPVGRHRAKVLTPFGIAVCIGVGEKVELLGGGPAMFWHPAGDVAARFAPILHGTRGVVVGQAILEWNGPSPNSLLTLTEDMQKFLHPAVRALTIAADGTREGVELDDSKWLNDGLFGSAPGDTLNGAVAVGVGYNPRRRMLDNYFSTPSSDVVVPSFEML